MASSGDLDRCDQAMETIGLVGPHAGLQPVRFVVVGHVDRSLIDAAARRRSRASRREPGRARRGGRGARPTTARPPWRRRRPATRSGTRSGRAAGSARRWRRRRAARADRPRRRGGRAPGRKIAQRPTSFVCVVRVARSVRSRSACGSTKRLNVGISDRIVGRPRRRRSGSGTSAPAPGAGSSSSRSWTQANSSTGSRCVGGAWSRSRYRSGSREIPADSAAYSGARGSDVVAEAANCRAISASTARIVHRVGHGATVPLRAVWLVPISSPNSRLATSSTTRPTVTRCVTRSPAARWRSTTAATRPPTACTSAT